MTETYDLKKRIAGLRLGQPVTRTNTPNESQYNADSAYGIVAYKNQNPESMSDLDLARVNFENKYKGFLEWYGQYSNVALTDSEGVPIRYPVNNFFDKYERLKPKS
jgi:hypothetical protein